VQVAHKIGLEMKLFFWLKVGLGAQTLTMSMLFSTPEI